MYVKICGLTSEAGVDAAVAAGADGLGFVLCASPREVSVATAQRLRARVPASIQVVAVVRHVDDDAVANAIAIRADLLQGAGPDRALPAGVRRLVACRADCVPEGTGWVLLDGPRPGSGQPTDFDVARRQAERRPLILAGGLSPDNVAEAIRYVNPAGVDVSSGVERQLGEKDPDLIQAFIQEARKMETSHDHDRRRP